MEAKNVAEQLGELNIPNQELQKEINGLQRKPFADLKQVAILH
ncbi:hypothetical protein [Geminocystis herdmanii]|nr:hypothetical protein [Geminocystis herdmanii]